MMSERIARRISRSSALVLFVVCAAAWIGSSTASAAEIRLAPRATVGGPLVRLGDVASIVASPELAARLAEIDLGRAPRVGQTDLLGRSAIVARVRRAIGSEAARVSFVGAPRIEIRASGRAWPVSSLEADAAIALREWLEERADVVQVERVESADDAVMMLPEGEVSVSASVDPGTRIAPRMRVWLDVSVDGLHYATRPVWFAVEAAGSALVSARAWPAGVVASPDAFEWAEVDLTTVRGRVAAEWPAHDRVRFVRSLAPGEALCEEDLEIAPAVARGDDVAVLARVGAVTVEARGIALQDGVTGARVRLRRAGGSERWTARVTEVGRVQLEGASR